MNLFALSEQFPVCSVPTIAGNISYRRAGAGPLCVLLHGIGSASGSWLRQLEVLQTTHTVLAWDAPGYGASDPLPAAEPDAGDYGARVWQWLEALGLDKQPMTLVGHSLGALMATAATVQRPTPVTRLVLLAPAQGHGKAETSAREKMLRDRLDKLQALGPEGLAAARGAAMLSPAAHADLRSWVTSLMAGIHPAGYTQAARMLAGADLATLLIHVCCPVTIASGSEDTITPETGCRRLAAATGASYLSLGPAGHACALEAAEAVNHLLNS